jgi:hypothetical protein
MYHLITTFDERNSFHSMHRTDLAIILDTRLPLSSYSDLGDIAASPLRGSLPAEQILLYINQSNT